MPMEGNNKINLQLEAIQKIIQGRHLFFMFQLSFQYYFSTCLFYFRLLKADFFIWKNRKGSYHRAAVMWLWR